MIDAPLYDNPLAGGISATPGIGGGTVSDTADRTIQDPYEIGGGGQLGLNDIVDRSSPTQVPGTNWTVAFGAVSYTHLTLPTKA